MKFCIIFIILNSVLSCKADCIFCLAPECKINMNDDSETMQKENHLGFYAVKEPFIFATIPRDSSRERIYTCTPKANEDDYLELQNALDQFSNISVLYFPKFYNLTLPENYFNQFKTLRILFLNTMSPEWFKSQSLESLQKLFINEAGLTSIEKDTFEYLINLRILDLSDNFIKTIHSDSFVNLKELKSLILDNNNITSIDFNFFMNFPNRNIQMFNNTCHDGGIMSMDRQDVLLGLSDCLLFYKQRTIIDEDLIYERIMELNLIKDQLNAFLNGTSALSQDAAEYLLAFENQFNNTENIPIIN